MDYHRNSSNPVAVWLFGREHQSKLPEDWQLDPYPDRYCGHPRTSEAVGDYVASRFVENRRGSRKAAPAYEIYKKGDSRDLYNRYRSNRTVFDWLLAIKAATDIPTLEENSVNRNSARRGITLIVAGVTVVMVLVFSLSVNPVSANAGFAAPLCGNGSAPDYGFTYDLQQAHWTVDWQGYVSEQVVSEVDVILDRLNGVPGGIIQNDGIVKTSAYNAVDSLLPRMGDF